MGKKLSLPFHRTIPVKGERLLGEGREEEGKKIVVSPQSAGRWLFVGGAKSGNLD